MANALFADNKANEFLLKLDVQLPERKQLGKNRVKLAEELEIRLANEIGPEGSLTMLFKWAQIFRTIGALNCIKVFEEWQKQNDGL